MSEMDGERRKMVNDLVVGQNVRRARKAKRMQQEDVAYQIGISTSHYSNCERGERRFSLDLLLQLCACLQVSLDKLLDGAISEAYLPDASAMGSTERLWTEEMTKLQMGCSDKARKCMLDTCKSIASLDKERARR